MNSKIVPRRSPQLSLSMLVMAVFCLLCTGLQINGFVPQLQTIPAPVPIKGRPNNALQQQRKWGLWPRICLRAVGSDGGETNRNENDDKYPNDDGDEEDQQQHVSDFYFDMSKNNIDARASMDAGIYKLLGGASGGTMANPANGSGFQQTPPAASPNSSTVVIIDWECLLDALPYHIELGIHAARTTWPHLNDLCNFDTDRDWLENKLFAMSHVLGSPEQPDKSRHTACEYALATRLILEEQALDRNESTGKNGKYARKFHPRSEINGNKDFEKDQSRSRRPLTAGELAVNWREFIRSTLIVKYARGPDGGISKQEPMEALESAIETYLSLKPNSKTEEESSKVESASSSALPRMVVKSLPLFRQTKFAMMNSSSKLVVRISHKFDNEIVSRSLNQQLRLLPQERIAKTYKPENAIRRLFLHNNKNNESNSNHIVLLQKPDHRYEIFNPTEFSNTNDQSGGSRQNESTSEENCLKEIMKFTHQCEAACRAKESSKDNPKKDPESTTPSVVWIDSSWHRLQGLAPVFGDTIPGGRNGERNTARCSIANQGNDERGEESEDDEEKTQDVWLSLWLAEWPSKETTGSYSSTSSKETARKNRISSSSSSENHEAAMVFPWTDSLSWETAEDILIPATWGSSDNAFQ